MKHKTRNILIGIAAFLVAAYFAVGFSCYLVIGNVRGSCGEHAVNRPDKILFTDGWPDMDLARYAISPYEAVRFPSRQSGIEIAGYWAEAKPGAPAVILVHGLGGCKNAIDVLVPAGMLWRNGFNVLLIDVRDVGDSDPEDGWTSVGNDESLDVLGALGLVGGSQRLCTGAGGHLRCLAGRGHRALCVSRRAAYRRLVPRGHLCQPAGDRRLPVDRLRLPGFMAQPAAATFRLVSGENIMARTPIEAISGVGDRPVYIVHSRGDHAHQHQPEPRAGRGRT